MRGGVISGVMRGVRGGVMRGVDGVRTWVRSLDVSLS